MLRVLRDHATQCAQKRTHASTASAFLRVRSLVRAFSAWRKYSHSRHAVDSLYESYYYFILFFYVLFIIIFSSYSRHLKATYYGSLSTRESKEKSVRSLGKIHHCSLATQTSCNHFWCPLQNGHPRKGFCKLDQVCHVQKKGGSCRYNLIVRRIYYIYITYIHSSRYEMQKKIADGFLFEVERCLSHPNCHKEVF